MINLPTLFIANSRIGRGKRIRTSDPLLPKQMRYQAAPCPDYRNITFPTEPKGQRGHDHTYGPSVGQFPFLPVFYRGAAFGIVPAVVDDLLRLPR